MAPTAADRLTLAGILRRQAADRPDHVAIRCDERTWTYGELDRRASQVARALEADGVGAGDRVAMLDVTSPEQMELIFGAAKLGALPAPLSFRLSAEELLTVLEDAEPKVLFVGAGFAGLGQAATDRLGIPVIALGAGTGFPDYAAWSTGAGGEDPGHRADPDGVAMLLYSSGTTGVPKGIMVSHANMASSFTTYPEMTGLDGDARSLVALPLFHVGGVGWALVGFIEGATNVVVPTPVPADLVRTISEERLTHIAVVPALLQMMLDVDGVADRDWSALRCCFYGASPINESLLRRAVGVLGCDFYQAYGSSETTGTTLVLWPEDHVVDGPHQHRLASAGRPRPGHEVRVVEPGTNRDVATGEIGEVLIRGGNVMLGYWNKPRETEEALVDGWLQMGDAGYLDGDGYLYLHDRVKDMVVSGGENIYSVELERVLQDHPGVADVAVIAVPSDRWGETPKAIVVRQADSDVDEQALMDHCREHLAGFKVPSSVDFVDELPRSATGKILKKDLRAPYWSGRDRQVG